MTVQNIMVPFQSDAGGAVAFKAGAIFAKRFKAHLDVVHIRRRFPLPAISHYPIAGAYLEENVSAMVANEAPLAAELKERYATLCGEHDVGAAEMTAHAEAKGATAAWSDLQTNYSFDFANRARLADLTVAARPDGDSTDDEMALIEELIFQSGRPVFLVDEACAAAPFPKNVAVAWDGGREAARALSATLPLLKEAETVVLISIGEIKRAAEPPERAAAYLQLHGVHALHAHPGARKGQSAAESFLEQAEGENADLIVMGAYSHNRWREVILGGFTRHMLNHTGIRVVISH